jgi:NlpC/P60 family putative phage cell wall peptidase
MPLYSRDWGEAGPVEVLAEGARMAMIEIASAEAGPGAMLLFRMRPDAIAKHVCIVTAADRFIHAYERLGVIEEPLSAAWRRRVAFAFLFPADEALQ